MKKLLSTALLILFAINLMATVYWVSPTGTDAATGRTRSAAWQTLDKVSAEMQTGDIIRFKRAATWNDTLFVNASNVQLIAWGEGKEPVIQFVYVDTLAHSISFQNITVTTFLYPEPPEPEPEQYPETYTGTIYYVSNDGSDSNDGTKAEPFASVTKVNTLTLSGGDAVLFNSVDTFAGTVAVGQSGSSGSPITFGAYGAIASKPVISGSEEITGWTLHSGSIWKATFATDITQLFVDGEKMKLARLTNSGYNLVTGVTSRSVVTVDAVSQADNYYVGATAITRTENWYSQARVVTASNGSTTLTLDAVVSADFNTGEGILLINKLEFLDAPGEWYYDSVNDLVYVWMPAGDSPAGYEMRGSTIDLGIDINTKSFITVKNLNILHQKVNGIQATGTGSSSGNVITENTIRGQEGSGIYGHNTDAQDITVTDNIISNCNEAGIYFRNIGNSTIENNTVTDIGLMNEIGTLSNGIQGNGSGIACVVGDASGKNFVKYNNIQNVNYNGIRFTGLSDIQYNFIKNSLLHKGDGGGIYTETAPGSLISYNIIDGALGSTEGRPSGALTFGHGIYTDEVASDITVEHNSVINVTHAALYTNRVDNCVFRYNKTLDARYGISKTNYSGTTPSVIEYNTFITGSATDDYEPRQLVARYGDGNATFDNNTYINGFASDLVFRVSDGSYKNFTDWKTFTSQDAASTYIGTALAGRSQRLVYNNTTDTLKYYLNAATSATDENGTAIPDSFYVAPFEAEYVRSINVDSISIVKAEVVPIDLTGNLLANYYFTETSGTTSNDLIGTADGTINGGPTMDGTKFTLDGVDDYVSFPLPTVLSSNQYNVDFSINIKFTVFGTPAAAKRLFYQASSFTRGIQIVYNTNPDLYAIITENDIPATSGKIKSGGVTANVPHNVTVTWEAATNTLRMYIDGTEITATYSSNGLNGNSSGMRLGSSLNAAYINADVYELSVFDKKLSGTEVVQWINR